VFTIAKRGFSECKGCGITVPTEQTTVYSNKKYCKACYEQKQAEGQAYKDLIKTICEYFQLDMPTGLIQKHIKEFKEQLGYTHGGMQYTLYYCKEILGKTFDSKYGIALVKYEYKNAENYFLQQMKIQESVAAVNKVEVKVREVKVGVKKQEKKQLLFNLDELLKGGEV
jgi:hypothetical protein